MKKPQKQKEIKYNNVVSYIKETLLKFYVLKEKKLDIIEPAMPQIRIMINIYDNASKIILNYKNNLTNRSIQKLTKISYTISLEELIELIDFILRENNISGISIELKTFELYFEQKAQSNDIELSINFENYGLKDQYTSFLLNEYSSHIEQIDNLKKR